MTPRIDVLTLFPKMFESPFAESIVARARAAGQIELAVHDIREWATDRHHVVDDAPYGGGAGMVLKPEPLRFWKFDRVSVPAPTVFWLEPCSARLTVTPEAEWA